MNILFIGDVVGRPGRSTVAKLLPGLKKELKIDAVFANCENAAFGIGLTIDKYHELIEMGIDYITSGNHIWKKRDFVPHLDDPKVKVLRPLNYPSGAPGRGYDTIKIKNKTILLINLIGRAYFSESFDDPFRMVDEVLKKHKADIILVDHHAEATSNKKLMGYYLDGRATAVVGTHTHVATADAMILPKGSAYITDVGMVGVLHSSLGGDLETFMHGELTQTPVAYKVASGDTIFNAVLIKVDNKTNEAKEIQLIQRYIKNPKS